MSVGRLFSALLAARAGFGLAYLAAVLGRWPRFQYYPLEHRWTFEAVPVGFAMTWYGTTAFALGVAVVCGAAAWAVGSRPSVARALGRPATLHALARAGAMILLVDYAYFGWTLTHQTPAPLPLPDWYCPR